jgi:hypothetical protein
LNIFVITDFVFAAVLSLGLMLFTVLRSTPIFQD